MGLIINTELDSGLFVNNSYARVRYIGGSKEIMSLCLDYYVDKNSFAEGKSVVQSKDYAFTPNVALNSLNFIRQGYEYLKTLPDFVNAVDDLE